jgi:TRAP-type C4-dicarboxylate transport system substrate-binding protein
MAFLMSKKSWDGMSEAEHRIVREAAEEAKQFQRKATVDQEAKSIDGLKKDMQVNEVSTAEMARLRAKVQPVVDKFAKEVGESVYGQVSAELTRMRGAN